MGDYQELLSTVIELEEKLREMYQVFAGKFPAKAEQMPARAGEKDKHAEWLRDLLVLCKKNDTQLNTTATPRAVRLSTRHRDRIISEYESRGMSAARALTMADDLAQGIIDSKLLTSFNFGEGKFKLLGGKLQQETSRHKEKLQALTADLTG